MCIALLIIPLCFYWMFNCKHIKRHSCRNEKLNKIQLESVFQFSCSVVSDSLRPHEPQHTSLSITNSQSPPKPMSIESMMPSRHLILCLPLLLLPSIFPNIMVFSNELALCIRWPKYWSFSFSISPSSEYWNLFPLGLTGLISFQSKGLSRVFSSTTVRKHQFFGTKPAILSNSHICT